MVALTSELWRPRWRRWVALVLRGLGQRVISIEHYRAGKELLHMSIGDTTATRTSCSGRMMVDSGGTVKKAGPRKSRVLWL